MQAIDNTFADDLGVTGALTAACERIAPTWSLDQMIAVSPYWEQRGEHISTVTARLGAFARIRSHMAPSFYSRRPELALTNDHLEAAARELGLDLEALKQETPHVEPAGHWHNVSDLLDSERDRQHKMAWRDEITQQISQFCAAAFQSDGPVPTPEKPGDLYGRWLEMTREDRGIPILMGEAALGEQFAHLPEDRLELLEEASEALGITTEDATAYAHALLLDINGWASWVAYLRWQDRLEGRDNALMIDLLAIRLAWELALWRHMEATDSYGFRRCEFLWRRQLATLPQLLRNHERQQQRDWLWQRAAELAYQSALHEQLRAPAPTAEAAEPRLQAAFCIDVRSEVFRRHLEAQDPSIETLGFAGFFGLPIAAKPAGTDFSRPQLPGLLAPAIHAEERTTQDHRTRRLNQKARWAELGDAPLAMFSLVETTGPLYAFKLLKNSLFPSAHAHPVNDLDGESHWELCREGEPLSVEERVALAASVLHGMGLEAGFAPEVLLVGHGSTSRNNPHAASLDCGACGGQTGELNARVVAELLNDAAVRDGLAERGVKIPAETRFHAALHNTTTDEVACFEEDGLSAEARRWLDDASTAARRERADSLGLDANASGRSLKGAMKKRAQDWSQVRPEWGLAGNAAFVVAPRTRTHHLDLGGRVFLHEYDAAQDPDLGVLELIMTAPMLVTHWINMQYNASTTDNFRYGSGNKVLHNVVGGNLGVFEGNGGDLRIGLPMQSLHDGDRWMHEPLRLSVYLAAPAEAIRTVYERHQVVRDLVDNEWLFLFRLGVDNGESQVIERLHKDTWISA